VRRLTSKLRMRESPPELQELEAEIGGLTFLHKGKLVKLPRNRNQSPQATGV